MTSLAARLKPEPVPVITVSVIIPTFRRADGLAAAMASVRAQTGLDAVAVTLIVCDNSPEASAHPQVIAFGLDAPFPVVFVHEPATGVANARNAAVAVSKTQFIAFLDDDEEAPREWLSRLLGTQAQFDADVVFGPVAARLATPDIAHRDYFTGFFSRLGATGSERLSIYYGCGNSLIRASRMPVTAPFSVTHNNMGGEDDKLFHGLMQDGAVMAWAGHAPVWEDVPASRSRLSYTLRRAFAYGQGPSYTAALNGRPVACFGWMVQGMAQFLLFGIWGTALMMMGRAQAAARLDKAARGLGKMLWFEPFKIGFYGTALLKKKESK